MTCREKVFSLFYTLRDGCRASLLVAFLACTACMLGSCDYWGEDWYRVHESERQSEGTTAGSSGSDSGSGSSSVAGRQQLVYTSTDSRNGYFNVNGGEYRTCTVSGDSNGGTVTFSNGTSPDLTGSFGQEVAAKAIPVALSAAFVGDGIIQGRGWTITFQYPICCTYTAFIGNCFICIKEVSENGIEKMFMGGDGTVIVPGSADDPFSGNQYYAFYFENGVVYYGDIGSKRSHNNEFPIYEYIVKETDDGYKALFCFSSYRYESGFSLMQNAVLLLRSKDADEALYYAEIYSVVDGKVSFGDTKLFASYWEKKL